MSFLVFQFFKEQNILSLENWEFNLLVHAGIWYTILPANVDIIKNMDNYMGAFFFHEK